MEKSAVCYEARAAHNVMNGIKHTQEAALVSGVSELILFLRNPPAPLSSDPQLEVIRSIFLFQCSKCKHEEVPCLRCWGASRTGRDAGGVVRCVSAMQAPLGLFQQSVKVQCIILALHRTGTRLIWAVKHSQLVSYTRVIC